MYLSFDCRMESNSFSDVKWIPCLGRKFSLCDLYDCCTDEMVIGSSIWDEKAVHEAKIEKAGEICKNEYTTCVPHTIEKKVSCLGINGELYLSCAAGHIKLEGEAKFYNDEIASKNVIRVALKCCTSSKITQISKRILESPSINTFEQESATDVITGIEYGAISIIVCHQKVQDKHDVKAAYENLHTKIKYLQNCISGNHNEMFSSIESNSENITCKIFSTLDLSHKTETMSSYTDAVALCKDLFKLHADKSTHVPIKASLSPLKRINKNFMKCAKNINETGLIIDIQCTHDIMNNMDLDLMDLHVIAENTLPGITEKIESYNISNKNLQSEFSRVLGYLVPKYRKGLIEECTLKEEIKTLFEKTKAQHILIQNKIKEIQQIRVFMKAVKDFELITISSDVFFHNDYVICLEFNTSHLIDNERPTDMPWYHDKKAIAEIRHKIKQFLKFAKENNNIKSTKFGFSNFSDQTCRELVVVNLYFDKEVLLFEPPTVPGKPFGSQITESTITLTWSEPQHGAQSITSYLIYFRKADDDEWNLYSTEISKSNYNAIIENLEANTGYIFKVCATLRIHCIIIESQVSEIIYTTKLVDAKTGKSSISPTPTKAENTSNSQEMTLRTTTHTHTKGAAHAPGQKVSNGQSESKTAPQDMERDGLQDPTRKDSGNNTHAQKPPIKNIRPKGSTIKALYDANKCEQLSAGNSTLYKLHVSKEQGKLMDVKIFNLGGKRNLKLPEIIILLVGATGAGKTTLINGIANYIFRVEWKDPERVVLTEHYTDKKGPSQAQSQTKSIEVYKINHGKHDQLSYNLTIIDTPGFEDTDGLKTDQSIMTKIQDLLTSDQVIDHINGIGFVVQAPLPRLTTTQLYVIQSVYSLFGNDVVNNIFVLATFTDNLSSPPVLNALDEAKIHYNKFFKFNNSALYANPNKTDTKGSINKSYWEIGMESFSKFFTELEEIKPVTLNLTKELLNERKKLQSILEGLKKKINCEFLNMQKLEYEEQTLNKYKSEAENNETFQYQEYIIQHELVPFESQYQLATNCHKCKISCHDDCLEYGQCNMMRFEEHKGYICTVCKCHINEHDTTNNYYHTYSGTEIKTIKHIKEKYDEAQNAQINIEKQIAKITDELEKVRKIIRKRLLDMHKCIQHINQISLQPTNITEVDYISNLVVVENNEKSQGYTSRIKFYQDFLNDLQKKFSSEV